LSKFVTNGFVQAFEIFVSWTIPYLYLYILNKMHKIKERGNWMENENI